MAFHLELCPVEGARVSTDRQTQTDRQTDRQIDRQTDRQNKVHVAMSHLMEHVRVTQTRARAFPL